MFTKYGYFTLGITAIIAFLLISLSFYVQNNYFKAVLIILSVTLLFFTMNFFRDPERTPPAGNNLIVSPADGKIILIKEVEDNNYIKGKAKQISIFMSPLDVHVNRIPINGKVEYVKYFKGKYIAAFEDKASDVNERAEFGIKSSFGKVLFTQVAGFIARRIVYNIKKGDSVHVGERFGMIKFGSRVDVIAPINWKEKVQKNQQVTAGETILFEYTEK